MIATPLTTLDIATVLGNQLRSHSFSTKDRIHDFGILNLDTAKHGHALPRGRFVSVPSVIDPNALTVSYLISTP